MKSKRGRPRGRSNIYEKALNSIIRIANKHNFDPKLLVDAFVNAWRNKKAQLRGLKIRCRKVREDSAVFLVTKGKNVVSQFSISLEALRTPKPFKEFLQHIPRPTPKKMITQKQVRVNELQVGMKRVEVKAEVIEIPPRRRVFTWWGRQSFVSNALIADETGSIRLSLWNEQIDKVDVGDAVEVENGYVSSFAGKAQLRISINGRLSVV
jgi:replication factor A1